MPDLTVSWRNASNPLLTGASVTFKIGGTDVPMPVAGGVATGTLPPSTGTVRRAELTVSFIATGPGGTIGQVLNIVQRFDVPDTAVFGFGLLTSPLPVDYDVPVAGAVRRSPGLHPLLIQAAFNDWRLIVNTRLVDVTALQPRFTGALAVLNPRQAGLPPNSVPRVLARTDGAVPALWITSTPDACRARAGSDVLCLFAPPQGSPAALPIDQQLADPQAVRGRVAVFLGSGVHATAPPPGTERFLDHFTPFGAGLPNFVLARGLEAAVVASGRPVALAMPVPAANSHNQAAGPELPGFLKDVHRTLHALGDIAPPVTGPNEATAAVEAPGFGIAAHSNGGPALFAALTANPKAFKEIMLFEAQETAKNLPALFRAKGAHVCLAGFAPATVGGIAGAVTGVFGAANVLRLPNPPSYPPNGATPETATIAQLVARSATLRHAIEPLATPAESWVPRTLTIAGKPVSERFELLHQYCMQGADTDGGGAELHYLTQAINGSRLRT